MKYLLSTLLLIVSTQLFGQFTGPTSVCKDIVYTYEYYDDVAYDNYTWTVTGGGTLAKGSGLRRGIKWSSDGSVTVKLYRYGNVVSQQTKNVKISKPGSISGPTSVCKGGSITITKSGTVGAYTWQKSTDGGSTWVNLPYASSLTDAPTVTSKYRLKINSCKTNNVSNVRTVTVYESKKGTLNVTGGSSVCASGTVSLSLTGAQGTVKWQRRYKRGSSGAYTSWYTFATNTASSATHSVTTGGGTVNRYYQFRVLVKDGSCAELTGNTRSTTVYASTANGTLSVSGSNSFCTSGTVNLSLSGTVGERSWQRRYKNGETASWSSWYTFEKNWDNTNTFNVATTSSYNRIYEFRVSPKNGSCGRLWGNRVTVTVYRNSTVGTLSASSNTTFCSSGTVDLNLSAAPVGTATWKSRYKDETGNWSGWSPFTPTNSTSGSVNVSAPNGENRNYEFKVEADNGSCNTVTSNVVTALVYTPTLKGTLSVNGASEFCTSGTVNLSLSGTKGTRSWQRRFKDGENGSWTTWYTFAENWNDTNTWNVTAGSNFNRFYEFRVSPQNGNCQRLYGNAVTVVAYTGSVVGTLSASSSTSFCSSGTVDLNLSAAPIGTATWKSRYKDASGNWTGWSPFTPTNNTSGSVNVSAPNGENRNYEFKVEADNGSCSPVTSNVITALVYPSSAIGNLNVSGGLHHYGSSGALNLSVSSNTGTVSYQKDAGSGWVATSSAVSPIASPTQFRARAKSGSCSYIYSTPVTVNVYDVPVATLNGAADVTVGVPTTLTVQSGFHAYQWVKDGANIAGATGTSVEVKEPGVYRVKVKGASGAPWYNSNDIEIGSSLWNQPIVVNYKVTTEIFKEGFTENDNFYDLQSGEVRQSVNYMDGYGRSLQQVLIGQSPLRKDIVQPFSYDEAGRSKYQYLGYAEDHVNGKYKEHAIRNPSSGNYVGSRQYDFYQQGGEIASDVRPYSENWFEESVMNRVIEHGGVGYDWRLGSAHSTKAGFLLNNSSHTEGALKNIRKWTVNGPNGYYGNNTIAISRVVDANGNNSWVFTDKLGRTILKRVELDEMQEGVYTPFLETYYVYDNRGNLAMQIPPKAVAKLNAGATWNAAFSNEWCFKYTYDERNRLVEKKSPDAAPMYYAYDPLDRLVLTQDGNMRASNQWAFIKYDKKGRAVMTGIYTNTTQTTRNAIQTNVLDGLYAGAEAWYETKGNTAHGYTNQSFPTQNSDGSALDILAVSYYDNYDFDNDGADDFAYTNQGLTGEGQQYDAWGMSTGSKMVIMGTNDWLYNYVFYDKYGRAIQSRSNNHLDLTVNDLTTNVFAFDGTLTYSKATHHGAGATVVTTLQRAVYDHAGRILEVYQTIDGGSETLVAAYEYNELGQVIDKNLHGLGGGNFMQSVDYRYNIKGWLQSINNADLAMDADNNDDTGDYFGMEFLYNTVETGLNDQAGDERNWNGRISAIMWKGPDGRASHAEATGGKRSYKYAYDKTSRLKEATFQAKSLTAWDKEVNTLDVALEYDVNGNITTLLRNHNLRGMNGLDITSTAEQMDNLTYTYTTGNQLAKVEDAASAEGGFTNDVDLAEEYTYNANGSATADANKGISAVSYNVLGKADEIQFTDGRRLEYTYSSAGLKLTMKSYDTDGTTLKSVTDYVNGYVYTDGALAFFGAPEGRIVNNGGAYERQYALRDHQGNTRVIFSTEAAPAQVYATDFESETNTDFENYPTGASRSSFALFDHTENGTSTHSQLLNAGNNSQVGVAKSMKVFPGDKVKIEAYAKYYNANSQQSNLTGFASALTSAFGVTASSTGEAALAYDGLDSYGSIIASGGGGGTTTYPKAFVTILLFDTNHKLVDFAYEQIDGGEQVGATKAPHDHMMSEYEVQEAGYAYVYVSNENPTYVEVYFDDVEITYTPSNIVQYNEYYPFGLQTAASWTREGSNNDYLYNAGNELNKESGWYETFYRGYDAALGKFMQVDPMVDKYGSYSPYNYALNMPNILNDPLGDDAADHSRNPGGKKKLFGEGKGYQDYHMGGGAMFGETWNAETYGTGFTKHGTGVWTGPTMEQIAFAKEVGGTITHGMNKYGQMGTWIMWDDKEELSEEEKEELMEEFNAMPLDHELIERAKFFLDKSLNNSQAGLIDETAMGLWSISSFSAGAYQMAQEGSLLRHNLKYLKELQQIRNFNTRYKTARQATLIKNITSNTKLLQGAKLAGRRMAGVGLIIGAVDAANKGTAEAWGWVAADTIMTAVAFVPGGALVSGIYFGGRFAYDLYEMATSDEN